MKKAELVEKIACEVGISKALADKVLNSTMANITNSMAKGEAIQLIGFGSFKLNLRAARTVLHPRSGERVKIPKVKTVKFTAGKDLKNAINTSKTKKSKIS